MSNPSRRNLVNFIIVLTFARKKETRVGVSKKSDEEMRRIFLLFSFSLLERMGDNSGANQNFTIRDHNARTKTSVDVGWW